MSATDTTPVVESVPDASLDDGDHERLAHVSRKADEANGYLLGIPVVALCGKKWIPTKNPQNYDVCKTCMEILGMPT